MKICIFNVFNFNGNSVDISEYSVGNNVEQYMIWFDKSNLFYILFKFREIQGDKGKYFGEIPFYYYIYIYLAFLFLSCLFYLVYIFLSLFQFIYFFNFC